MSYQSRSATATLTRTQANVEIIRPSIQFDPRVRRGPSLTGTARENLAKTQLAPKPQTPVKDKFSIESIKKKKEKLLETGKIRPAQPSVAALHAEINSKLVKIRTEFPRELYLEEQIEPILMKNCGEQCDESEFLPEEPLEFLPRVAGDRESSAQVDPSEIFNFDRDSAPLLEVLTSKILDSALVEVREEEELIKIRQITREYRDKFEREEEKGKQLAELELKLHEKKLFQMKIQENLMKKQWKLKNKLLSKSLSQIYLNGIQSKLLNQLEYLFSENSSGNYLEEWKIQENTEINFLPDIENRIQREFQSIQTNQILLNQLTELGILQFIESNEQFLQEKLKQKEIQEKNQQIQCEQMELERLKGKKIQLFINCESLLKERVKNSDENQTTLFGPFPLTGASTFQSIEESIKEFFIPKEKSEEEKEEEEEQSEETEENETREPPVPLNELPFMWENRIQFSFRTQPPTESAAGRENSSGSFALSPSEEAAARALRFSSVSSSIPSDTIFVRSAEDFSLSLAELEIRHGRSALSQIRLSLRDLTPEESQAWEVEKIRREQEKQAAEEEEEEDEERE